MAEILTGLENTHPPDNSPDFGGRMSCGKKVTLVFGAVLILAAIYIPYQVKIVSHELNPQTRLIMRRTSYGRGFMLLPAYLAAKAKEPSDRNAPGRYYVLNSRVIAIEFGLIIFLGGLDYLLFCRFLRQSAAGRARTDD